MKDESNKNQVHGIEKSNETKLYNRLQMTRKYIWRPDREIGSIFKPFITIIRVFTVSLKKFIQDDCISRASIIAYSVVVSLIPTLTVGFSLFSAFSGLGKRKHEIFSQAKNYLRDHDINIDIQPFLKAIESLTDNAASVGGIGLIVLIFFCNSSIEDS